jgi:hypothetical protein
MINVFIVHILTFFILLLLMMMIIIFKKALKARRRILMMMIILKDVDLLIMLMEVLVFVQDSDQHHQFQLNIEEIMLD